MTNHWADLENSKVFLIEGSNAAENHVMAMKWIRKAQEKGAKIIHVDPRYNRTSGIADVYARIRPGADIAFLGAIIRLVIENGWYDAEYVKIHTNALFVARDDFGIEDGLFSGYDREKHTYDTVSWGYQLGKDQKPQKANTLDDPRTVFQKLRHHFSRYTPQMAEQISGVPAKQIEEIAELFAKNRPGTILYALGMTQHTVGVQNIRCYCILQLLLGNIGKVGGGVNALRGEPNVQGACDMGVLNNYMPGYLDYPSHTEPTLEAWATKNGTVRAKYLINTLKAFYGTSATKENGFRYEWLPKKHLAKDYSVNGIFESALAREMKMLWIVGQNPAVTSPNLKVVFEGLENLETLVVQEIWDTETASFWQRPGADPKQIQTEVFLLPASFFMEKNGSISNSGAMVQWRHKAVDAPGQARPDGEIVDFVFRRVRDLVVNSTDPQDEIIRNAFWTYTTAEDFLREISGRALEDIPDTPLKAGTYVSRIADLKPNGSTSSGCWIYAGVFANGENLSKRRDFKTDPGNLGLFPNFGWAWPNNMRVLYNRASWDRHGKPYPDTKPLVWRAEKAGRWTGYDVPDVPVATDGPNTPNGQRAFHMNAEGVGRLFAAVYQDPNTNPLLEDFPRDASYVPKDGPLPEM